MDAFCGVCHPIKADQATMKEPAVLFTSMDETGNRVMPKAGSSADKAPAAAEKKPAKK